ncbi:MAG: ABC transporter substrate-binding protein, partial [Chloroflexota bacterium]
ADPTTLNLATTTGYSDGDVASKVYEGLVWLDAEYKPQPALAMSWAISSDAKTYTLKLRPNVKWHDGKDFTSADVKFTFEHVLAKFHPRMRVTLKRLAGVETPDSHTAVIKLTEPYAPFYVQLSVFDAPILPQHLYQTGDVTKNPYNQKPVGTGPFRFSQWNRGSSLKVVRNPSYWDKDKPYLDAIVFQIIPQGPSRATALETGQIDFLPDFYLAKANVPQLSGDTKLQSKRGQGSPAIDFLMMNNTVPALAKKQARQALAFGINRDTLVRQAMSGLARPAVGAFGDGFKWLVNPQVSYQVKYPYSADKARMAMIVANVGNHPPLRLVYEATRPQFASGAQIIQDNLSQFGVEVNLQPLERAVMIQKVYVARDFDLTLQSFVSGGDPAVGYHRLYLTNNNKTPFTNASGYSNPKVDTLLNQAASLPTIDQRAPIYKQLQVILNDEVPTLVLFDAAGVDFASNKLSGLWQSIDSRDRWGQVSTSR